MAGVLRCLLSFFTVIANLAVMVTVYSSIESACNNERTLFVLFSLCIYVCVYFVSVCLSVCFYYTVITVFSKMGGQLR